MKAAMSVKERRKSLGIEPSKISERTGGGSESSKSKAIKTLATISPSVYFPTPSVFLRPPPPPPPPTKAQLLTEKLKALPRSRNTKFPGHSSAAPIIKLIPDEIEYNENNYEETQRRPKKTAAEVRKVRRLKRKLHKLQESLELNQPKQKAAPVTKTQRESVAGVASGEDANSSGSKRLTVEERLKTMREDLSKNVWKSICDRIKSEKYEMDLILLKIGLPPHNFRKDKSYPIKEYSEPPNLELCIAQDFADYYIFPILLSAIQSMIQFARKNRVFQCRYCTFNPLDYITEYLYNNNPKNPQRLQEPIPLYNISFAMEWIQKYPRKPFPKWLTMTSDVAARIIQRAVRGWLVRKNPDVQEMRQFWKDYQKDMEDDKLREQEEANQKIFSPYYEELLGESEIGDENGTENSSSTRIRPLSPFITHSDTCLVCHRFKEFLRYQEMQLAAAAAISTHEGHESEAEEEG